MTGSTPAPDHRESGFSVIICSYALARWPHLQDAVQSVRDQVRPATEIIVVIDGNPELRRRAQAELEGAVVVDNRHLPGLSGARQSGADLARSPWLAFLDDDAVAAPDWLAELAGALDDPLALGAGGAVLPLWLGARPRWLAPELDWIVGCTYAGMAHAGGRIRNPIGANMAMRADVLARVGTFEQRLGRTDSGTAVQGTAEETEFCIRAAQLHPGSYWVYRPQAAVEHVVPKTRGTLGYLVRRCRVEGSAKAILAELAGGQAGLQSERDYVRAVLPHAVARELGAATRGNLDGLRRAGAICLALLVTAAAYADQSLRLRWQTARAAGRRA